MTMQTQRRHQHNRLSDSEVQAFLEAGIVIAPTMTGRFNRSFNTGFWPACLTLGVLVLGAICLWALSG